jgi:hypothetical protein
LLNVSHDALDWLWLDPVDKVNTWKQMTTKPLVTVTAASPAQLGRVPTPPAERIALLLVLIFAAAIRLPFWPLHRDLGDALNYSIGALYSHVAHPPGSVGYCLLLGWINHLFHKIQFTLILVSFVGGMTAIVACHRAAKAMEMPTVAALAAVCLYGLSINTLKASLLGSPHILEGLCSLLLGWLVWKAIHEARRGRQLIDALLASLVFSAAGALRPTTTPLLFPLWLFMLWQTLGGTGRIQRFALHLLIVVPIIAAWSWGNSHYMTLAGYGGRTYQDQVLTGSSYDFESLSPGAAPSNAPEHLTFHMPGAELLAWVEVKTGLRLMPHVPGWPTPSLGRALRLLVTQTLKQGWFIVVSLPLVVVLPIAIWLEPGRLKGQALRQLFFAVWILPSIAFFVLGHMGMLTYLQVYLGGLCLWSADLLLGNPRAPRRSPFHRLAIAATLGCVVLNVAFFTLTRPFQSTGGVRGTLDLVLMQFDGYATRHNFGASRRGGVTTTLEQSTGPDHDYMTAPDDKALLDAAWRNHFQYLPQAGHESDTKQD